MLWGRGDDSISVVSAGRSHRPDRLCVRYRRADCESAETTLDRVVPDEVIAGLPVREFHWYQGRHHYSGWCQARVRPNGTARRAIGIERKRSMMPFAASSAAASARGVHGADA